MEKRNNYISFQGSSLGCSFVSTRRKSKTDWAGISIGDAFRHNLDYFIRIPAQRKFYRLVNKVQIAAARLSGQAKSVLQESLVKPQLSPFYTSYPANLAAYASIGWTAYLEYVSKCPGKSLRTYMEEYLENPEHYDAVFVEIEADKYAYLAEMVVEAVQTRITLEDLSRNPSLSFIEMYRLFSASQQNLSFENVNEILEAVILYGDIFPDWKDLTLHPMTRNLLKDTFSVSNEYFDLLPKTASHELLELGAKWARTLCHTLSVYMPACRQPDFEEQAGTQSSDNHCGSDVRPRYSTQVKADEWSNKIPPLKKAHAPSLISSSPDIDRLDIVLNMQMFDQKKLNRPDPTENSCMIVDSDSIGQLLNAVRKASSQKKEWEDIPYDLVESAMKSVGFKPGPIQESPIEGHEVKVKFEDKTVGQGEIHDRPLSISDDVAEYHRLLEDSQEMTRKMKRALYPNIQQVPQMEAFHTSGVINSLRLACADFSAAFFKRYRINEIPDRKGKPLLVIAADGSGSLDASQMKMLKILSVSWMNSTLNTGIQVLAGLYHSGRIRPDITGPLVQWIYHPQKTPATNRSEAARAIVSLPESGTGMQSDALSIRFMIDEAVRIAKGRMIYLILLTDCAWNRSFDSEKTGTEEVMTVLGTINIELKGKLHVTLVSLGNVVEDNIKKHVDKVITISDTDLNDTRKVAEQIGVYVASCIGERKKLTKNVRG